MKLFKSEKVFDICGNVHETNPCRKCLYEKRHPIRACSPERCYYFNNNSFSLDYIIKVPNFALL